MYIHNRKHGTVPEFVIASNSTSSMETSPNYFRRRMVSIPTCLKIAIEIIATLSMTDRQGSFSSDKGHLIIENMQQSTTNQG